MSRKYETELRPLDRIGLSDIAMDSALTLILNHVESTARARRQAVRVQEDSGMSDAAWWSIVGPALEQVMDNTAFTTSGRVGSAVGEQFDAANASSNHAFQFGLDTILDGIAAGIKNTES